MILLRVKATAQQIPLMTKQYSGYIKVVIDIQRRVLVGGNPSRDIMDTTIRKQFDAIVKELLL